MKHPETKMSLEGLQSPVDLVQDWLSKELEQLVGNEARLYTRFIISILRDGVEPDVAEYDDFWGPKKAVHYKKVEKQRCPDSQCEENRRKCAAVQFLQNISDTFQSLDGIRSLVDELSKRLNSSSEAVYAPLHVELEREREVKSADPTEQYYAAFPALTGETTPAVSPSSAEGDNIWCRKPLASQLAGKTQEKQDTCPNGIGSEAVHTPSGKQGSFESHSARRVRHPLSDRRGFELKPCKNGRKKNSSPGKKKPRIPESVAWSSTEGGAQQKAANMSSAESEECMQIEGVIKQMLFHSQRTVTNQNAEPNAGHRGLNPSPEFQENDQWYEKPLNDFIITPSLPTKRLYKRSNVPCHCFSLQDFVQFLNSDYVNEDWSQPSTFPDNDSGKDSAVVSDGDLSSGEEDQAKEKTPSIEICFAAHLMQSRLDDVAKSLSSSLEIACPQLDEEDSSQEPSIGSQEEETIFHLELDENEITPARYPRRDNPVDTASVSEPRMQVGGAYSIAGTFGQNQYQEGPQHSVASLHEDLYHIPEAGKDLVYSSEQLQSLVEEPLANGIDIVIEDTAAENEQETPAQDRTPSPAVLLPACLRNDLAAGEKSAQDGNVAIGACLPAYLWNALIDGEKYPEDATSFCPTSSLMPSRDWSAWSESPLGLGHSSTLRPCSRSCIEPAFHGCLNFTGLPSLEFNAQSPSSSALRNFLSFEVGIPNQEPVGEDSTSFQAFSLLPSDWSPWATTPQDWDMSACSHKPWSCPGPSYDQNGGQTFSPGFLSMFDAPMRLSTGASRDPALNFCGNAEGNILSPSAEKTPWHLWDVNLSRKAPLGWSIWSNRGIELPVMMMPNNSQQESRFSSTSQSPDADDLAKTKAENAGPSYSLFPKISKLGEVSINDWPSIFYGRSASEGDLHCYQRDAPFGGNHGNGQFESSELKPSENSAFCPYLKGHKSLLHVHSAPNMKFSFSDTKKDQENSDSVSEEDLLQSRYFRPIRTPLSTPEDELEFRPDDLFGGYTNQDSQYQRYRDPEEPANLVDEFQPKFKLQKNLDKYIQTSLDEKEETPSAAMPAMPGTCHDPFSSRAGRRNSTDAFHDADAQTEEPLEEQPKEVPADPWMDSRNVKQGSTSQQEERPRGNSILGYSDPIWSNGYDHDQDMPAKFPVTPLLSNSSTLSYSEPLAEGQPPLEDDVFHPPNVPDCQETLEPQNQPEELLKKDDSLAPNRHVALYAHVLENQWFSETSEARQSKTFSRTKNAKTSTNKKPCSYYMEGRCQRAGECKFSHELSTITCSFWRNNNCFKGSLCPFRHGFASEPETASPPPPEATTASPEFSELDFPALGWSNNNMGRPEK